MAKLLCTFTSKEQILRVIKEINDYNIILNTIEVFSEVKSKDYLLLYEVEKINQIPKRTLPVHKKSNTNTIYTINALNILVRNINNGIINRDVEIPWYNYSNKLLLTRGNNLIKKEIKFDQIIR